MSWQPGQETNETVKMFRLLAPLKRRTRKVLLLILLPWVGIFILVINIHLYLFKEIPKRPPHDKTLSNGNESIKENPVQNILLERMLTI
jgi:hypothetical protein